MSSNTVSSTDQSQSCLFVSQELEMLSSSSPDASSTPDVTPVRVDHSPSIHGYTSRRITQLLKKNPENYKIIKNSKSRLSSTCWQVFGFPAKKSIINDEFVIISGFASCRSCFQSYAFTSSSGTRALNAHPCVQELSNVTRQRSSSMNCDETLPKAGSIMKAFKQLKLPDKEIDSIKNLTCKWLCHDMRPFTIVEDIGFRNLLQKCISLGKQLKTFLFFL